MWRTTASPGWCRLPSASCRTLRTSLNLTITLPARRRSAADSACLMGRRIVFRVRVSRGLLGNVHLMRLSRTIVESRVASSLAVRNEDRRLGQLKLHRLPPSLRRMLGPALPHLRLIFHRRRLLTTCLRGLTSDLRRHLWRIIIPHHHLSISRRPILITDHLPRPHTLTHSLLLRHMSTHHVLHHHLHHPLLHHHHHRPHFHHTSTYLLHHHHPHPHRTTTHLHHHHHPHPHHTSTHLHLHHHLHLLLQHHHHHHHTSTPHLLHLFRLLRNHTFIHHFTTTANASNLCIFITSSPPPSPYVYTSPPPPATPTHASECSSPPSLVASPPPPPYKSSSPPPPSHKHSFPPYKHSSPPPLSPSPPPPYMYSLPPPPPPQHIALPQITGVSYASPPPPVIPYY